MDESETKNPALEEAAQTAADQQEEQEAQDVAEQGAQQAANQKTKLDTEAKQKKKRMMILVVGISVTLLLFTSGAGFATGLALLGLRINGEPTPSAAAGKGAGGCWLKDGAFRDNTTITSADQVLQKLNNDSRLVSQKDQLEKIISKSATPNSAEGLEHGVINPAILISFWAGEQSFDPKAIYKAFGCGHFKKGGDDSGFDNQLDCALPAIDDAIQNTGNYKEPVGANIWTRLLYNYVDAQRARCYRSRGLVSVAGDTSDSCHDPRIDILLKLVPEQVECTAGSASNTKYSSIKQALDNLGGSQAAIEKNLVDVSFRGKDIKIHKVAADALKQVESDIKSSGTNYQITSIGGYAWRGNVNNPGSLSAHALGLAVDINSSTNPNGPRPPSSAERDPNACKHDIPKEVSDAFEKNGFFWGAKFRSICDPMHFQYGGNYQ